MSTPKLNPEIEKRFDEFIFESIRKKDPNAIWSLYDECKSFIAEILAEQK